MVKEVPNLKGFVVERVVNGNKEFLGAGGDWQMVPVEKACVHTASGMIIVQGRIRANLKAVMRPATYENGRTTVTGPEINLHPSAVLPKGSSHICDCECEFVPPIAS